MPKIKLRPESFAEVREAIFDKRRWSGKQLAADVGIKFPTLYLQFYKHGMTLEAAEKIANQFQAWAVDMLNLATIIRAAAQRERENPSKSPLQPAKKKKAPAIAPAPEMAVESPPEGIVFEMYKPEEPAKKPRTGLVALAEEGWVQTQSEVPPLPEPPTPQRRVRNYPAPLGIRIGATSKLSRSSRERDESASPS